MSLQSNQVQLLLNDLRRFHNAVLDDGPLPLDMLAQRIDLWIRREQAAKLMPAGAAASADIGTKQR